MVLAKIENKPNNKSTDTFTPSDNKKEQALCKRD